LQCRAYLLAWKAWPPYFYFNVYVILSLAVLSSQVWPCLFSAYSMVFMLQVSLWSCYASLSFGIVHSVFAILVRARLCCGCSLLWVWALLIRQIWQLLFSVWDCITLQSIVLFKGSWYNTSHLTPLQSIFGEAYAFS